MYVYFLSVYTRTETNYWRPNSRRKNDVKILNVYILVRSLLLFLQANYSVRGFEQTLEKNIFRFFFSF